MAQRGRPAARVTIVDNVLPADRLVQFDCTILQLHRLYCFDDASVLRWAAQHGLIHNQFLCDECEQAMRLQARHGERYVNGYCWACPRCRGQKSVTCDSFFAGSHLTLIQLIDCIYWWAQQLKQSNACRETGMSVRAMVDWQNFIRDICCQYLLDHPVMLGGPGRTVEIDESKFMHRKYHRGRYHEGHWVLGMVERDTNTCMMVAVEDRSAATLLPIIAQHVQPGTRIITDGWQAYNQLPLPHDVVNHRLHFVDPNDPTLHTNTVEGSWALCKAKFRAMHGTSDALFESHMQEYLWRRIHQNNVFGNILYWIRHYYPV